MINGFPAQTKPLTADEMKCVNELIRTIAKYRKELPVTSTELCIILSHKGYVVSEPRIRKMINYIRSNKLLPVLASSNGYYTSFNKEDIIKEITSLQQRISAIENSIQGLTEIAESLEQIQKERQLQIQF